MKKRKVSKAARHRLFILVPITIIVVAYFLISFSYYTLKIYNLKKEEKSLQSQLNNLKEEEDTLKTDIEKLQNPEYLARYARENYHYSKEGELVIQRNDESETTEEEEETESSVQPIMVICIAGLMVVACYILKRKPKKR
jgi:cell division protein DivIC